MRKVRNMDLASEIACHVMDTGHGMDWLGARVLEKEHRYGKRIFKEAWWTEKLQAANRTKCVIDEAWRLKLQAV